MTWGFVPGVAYNRKTDIHGNFGGQPRPGIITPRDHAVIFLVSGRSGRKHGYDDTFHSDGRVSYFGMGQVGHMKMTSGNRAIADHSADGKSLLLFERRDKRQLFFVNEMVCEGYRVVQARDRNRKMRDAFVFDLAPLHLINLETRDLPPTQTSDLSVVRQRAFEASNPTPSKKSKPASVFERSRYVRDYVLARSRGRCELCLDDAPFQRSGGVPYLEAHHIFRLSDGGPDAPDLVIAVCPNCHREAHFGVKKQTLNKSMADRVKEIEESWTGSHHAALA